MSAVRDPIKKVRKEFTDIKQSVEDVRKTFEETRPRPLLKIRPLRRVGEALKRRGRGRFLKE